MTIIPSENKLNEVSAESNVKRNARLRAPLNHLLSLRNEKIPKTQLFWLPKPESKELNQSDIVRKPHYDMLTLKNCVYFFHGMYKLSHDRISGTLPVKINNRKNNFSSLSEV